jgi:hypothetical protein
MSVGIDGHTILKTGLDIDEYSFAIQILGEDSH